MSKVKSGRMTLWGLSVISAAAMAARATVTNSTYSISLSAPSNDTTYSSPFSVNVAPFNTTLGTLTAASINIAVSVGDVIYVVPAPVYDDGHNVVGYQTNSPYNATINVAQIGLITPYDNATQTDDFPNLSSDPYAYTLFGASPPQFFEPTLPVTYTGSTPATDTPTTVGVLPTSVSYLYNVPSTDLGLLSGQSATAVGFSVVSGVAMDTVNNQQYAGNFGNSLGAVSGTATVSYTYTPAVSNASGLWSAPSSGTWEVGANWQGGVFPTGAGQTAVFADSIGSGSATVILTANETVGNILFNGSSGGAYTVASNGSTALTLDNGGSPAVISVNAGAQTISAPISLPDGLTINTATGSLTLAGAVTGTGSVTVNPSSSLIVSPTGVISLGLVDEGKVTFSVQTTGGTVLPRVVPSLTIASGAVAAVPAAPAGIARQVLVTTVTNGTGGLNIAGSSGSWTGKLDLGNNDAIIQNGYQDLPTIVNQINQGYDSGSWQGSGGIVSSSAAANSSHLTALGVIRNDDGTHTGTPLLSSFDGVSVGDNDVLIKYTYYGDANLDGQVDGSDYTRIDAAYLADQTSPGSLTGWFNGDFNYDGVVDGSDYTLIDNAFNTQGAQIAALISSANAGSTAQLASVASSVPEPSVFTLVTAASLGLLDVRRRRKTTVESADPA